MIDKEYEEMLEEFYDEIDEISVLVSTGPVVVKASEYALLGGRIHAIRPIKGISNDIKKQCDCGAKKANTTHSDWCSTNG